MPGKKLDRVKAVAVLILCCAFLAGCATLNKNECMTADWRTIGYEDGAKGMPASRIGKHRKACARHGVAPDFNAYEQGRMEGLREYCTPERGYSLGVAGKKFPSVCPEELKPAMLDIYERGKVVYRAGKVFKRKQAALEKLYQDREAVIQKLNDYEAELVKDGTSETRRISLLKEIKILADEKHYIEDEIIQQEKVVEDARIRFHDVKRQNSL